MAMIEDCLEILDVLDPGVPNLERVPIRVVSPTSLHKYYLGVGIILEHGRLLPVNDNLMWLGSGTVLAGDIVFVYTGSGKPKESVIPNSSQKIFTLHWNRSRVLFSSGETKPFLLNGFISFKE